MVEAKFFQTYKRRFFIGLGVLLAFTCLALAYYNRLLGIGGLVTSLTGFYAFYYVDKQERSARERELREELLAVEREMPPEELPAASDLSLVFLQVDDYDEVFHGLPEDQRPLLVAAVDKLMREWAASAKAYLHKNSRDRYSMLMPTDELESQESKNFPILDEIRKIDYGNRVPVTLSFGAAKGVDPQEPAKQRELAQQALELALERGGDQAVVKSTEHTWFYGGHTEVVGKRSQVRVRVTATELARLINLAKNAVIMGHCRMDFDVLGAAVGWAEIVRHNGKKVRIVADNQGSAVDKLINRINEHYPGLV